MIKFSYDIIALMSGTSLDGIDLIYLTISYNGTWSYKIHHAETRAYTHKWKTILSELVGNTTEELTVLDRHYSELLGNEVRQFIERYNLRSVDFVASHGHTALHQPTRGITYQIGNTQAFSNTCGLKLVCDFRTQDVALGGQGAPLVPIGDRLLFGNYDYCLNLGGFANVSYEEDNKRLAFDICPVNIVLNYYASLLNKAYDDKGMMASQGELLPDLLQKLNVLPYYSHRSPKSLGLEWVKEAVFPLINAQDYEIKDVLRTSVEHIAIQISKVITDEHTQVLVTGGGAYNDFLMFRLMALSSAQFIKPQSKLVDYKEALIFGLLGVLRERNEINCLRSVTGARIDHCSGKIIEPET